MKTILSASMRNENGIWAVWVLEHSNETGYSKRLVLETKDLDEAMDKEIELDPKMKGKFKMSCEM